MASTLIVLRGNSGSGKTSTARLLQRQLGYGTMVVSQDVVRREMLRRHRMKPNCHEFGEAEMREWWKKKDYLDVLGETLIDETMSQDDIVQMIIHDVTGKTQKNKGA